MIRLMQSINCMFCVCGGLSETCAGNGCMYLITSLIICVVAETAGTMTGLQSLGLSTPHVAKLQTRVTTSCKSALPCGANLQPPHDAACEQAHASCDQDSNGMPSLHDDRSHMIGIQSVYQVADCPYRCHMQENYLIWQCDLIVQSTSAHVEDIHKNENSTLQQLYGFIQA